MSIFYFSPIRNESIQGVRLGGSGILKNSVQDNKDSLGTSKVAPLLAESDLSVMRRSFTFQNDHVSGDVKSPEPFVSSQREIVISGPPPSSLFDVDQPFSNLKRRNSDFLNGGRDTWLA